LGYEDEENAYLRRERGEIIDKDNTLLERGMLESMVRQKRTASLCGRLLVARGLQM